MICFLLILIFFDIQTSGRFLIEYEKIDSNLASEILITAEETLPIISNMLGYVYNRDITIKLISDIEQFHVLTQKGFPDWGVGFADSKSSLIIIYSPRVVKKDIDIRCITKHELAHIVLGGMVGSGRLPRWFNEGFAMLCSQEWRFGRERVLAIANMTNSLIPLSQLELTFPRDVRKAEIAYTESFSAVAYIIDNFGEEGFKEILTNLKIMDFDNALYLALGITYKEFTEEWEAWAKKTYNWAYFLLTGSFVLLLILLVFLVVLIISLKSRKRKLKELERDIVLKEEI